ncbi:EAL domain-containing protein [Salmonella enterica]
MVAGLYLSANMMDKLHLPDDVVLPGDEHLSCRHFRGLIFSRVTDLLTGTVCGTEIISLPASGMPKSYLDSLSATALSELFLMQLFLSRSLPTPVFITLPVRVLVSESLCGILASHDLRRVIIQIQDIEQVSVIRLRAVMILQKNVSELKRSGAQIYVRDVGLGQLETLCGLSLPLSGIKINRLTFQSACRSISTLPVLVSRLHALTPDIIVEGVDSQEQYLIAAMTGFTHAQGKLWPAKMRRLILGRRRTLHEKNTTDT